MSSGASDPEIEIKADPPADAPPKAVQEVVEIEPGPGEPPPPPPPHPPPPLRLSNLPPRDWPPKTVGDVMTRKVITVQEHEPLGDLEHWMARFRFRHLPVVGAGVKLCGLITLVDYLHALLGVAPDGKAIPKVNSTTPAHAVMNKNVVTARVDAPLVTALQVMLHEKLGCLPVVQEDNTLVGIVTQTDFTRLALELLQHQGQQG
jgi:CBS domain-containing protein